MKKTLCLLMAAIIAISLFGCNNADNPTDTSGTEQPTASAPVITAPPAAETPTAPPSTTQPATTTPPATEAPTTAPTTEPTTEPTAPPSTTAPATSTPPATEAPATVPPTTEPTTQPTTPPPATTTPPATTAPTTTPPTETQGLIDGKYTMQDLPILDQRPKVNTSANSITVGEFLKIVAENTFPSLCENIEPSSPDENPYLKYFFAAQMANKGSSCYKEEQYMSLYISRAEVANFIASLYARVYKEKIDLVDGYTNGLNCEDISKLPPWIYSYIYYCVQKDLMPIQNDSWKPFDGISEDELLDILEKLDYVY